MSEFDPLAPLVMVDVTLTCHTPGCGNEGVPIAMQVPEGTTAAQCGACGNPITDAVEGTPDD